MTLRFDKFELDVSAYTLRRRGRRVRVERRPMDLLILLVERHGQLVTRDDIVEHLWGRNVFIEIDAAVNSAIKKVRQALHDDAARPKFVETVPGKGYRFVASVATEPQPRPAVFASQTSAMIAVLPFVNLSPGPDRDYIANGFTEDVGAALAQIDPESLGVIGRTSCMAYAGSTKSLAEIGRALKVDYLLEGSIRVEGERWRISAKLIAAADQRQLWAESFDTQSSSVLALQREVGERIAEKIRLKLSASGSAAVQRRHSQNPRAYDLYLQGRHAWHQLTAETNRRALDYYTRATTLDSRYALAWSGIADVHAASAINADAPPLEVSTRARAAAANAVRADPKLAESQTSLGLVKYWFDWDWQGAELAHRAAVSLDASYVFGYVQLGIVLAYRQRHEAARLAMQRARELDPLSAVAHGLSAHVEFIARDYSTSLRFAQQAAVIRPGFWIAEFHRAQALERLGNQSEALETLKAAEPYGSNSKIISLRGYLLAKAGQYEAARAVLRTLETISRERYLPPYAMALVYAGLGDYDGAFSCLHHAYDARDVHLVFLMVDPKWDVVRGDSRFQRIIERCAFNAFQG
jgi:TolB-like protein